MIRIGIDLGGTKIEGIALGPGGVEMGRRRIPTPRDDYPGTIHAIAALVGWIEDAAGAPPRTASVGIAMPGAISPATGRVKNANSTWLNGQDLDRDLESALGRRARLANDANCFVVSEATDGAGAGRHLVFGIILGTGVGGGIAINGMALTGRNAIAGEWGHNPLPWPHDDERPGARCYCGRLGCIEGFLSGPALAADHRRVTGNKADAATIAALAEAGDAAALATMARYRNRLARSLAMVVNLIDPDIIVLGGGMSNVKALYPGLQELLAGWCFSDRISTEILPAAHGDSSGVRGAAWLWPEEKAA